MNMRQLLSTCLILVLAAAFGLQAVAAPCQAGQGKAGMDMSMDMPCHSMKTDKDAPAPFSGHDGERCCCPALLPPVLALNEVEFPAIRPELRLWSLPLQQAALSGPAEFEPPPPRA